MKGVPWALIRDAWAKRAQGDVCPCRKQKEAASRVSALAFYSLAGLSLEQASLFHCVDSVSP